MLFSLRSLFLLSLPLTYAVTERELEAAYQAQTRVVSLLKGRQVTTVPCAKVPAPATCASSCGPGWITCPGGSAKDCYNPTTEVCCGDGTTCPAGTTCNMSSLTCDGSGAFVGPTYTPTLTTSPLSYKSTTSTHKSTTSTYKASNTTHYTPATFSAPTSIIGVASSAPFFATSANAAASTATSMGGLGNIFTETSSFQVGGATSSSSSGGVVQSNDGGEVGCGFFGVGVAMAAGLLLL